MTDVRGELGDVVKVSYFAGVIAVGARRNGIYERLMISENAEIASF